MTARDRIVSQAHIPAHSLVALFARSSVLPGRALQPNTSSISIHTNFLFHSSSSLGLPSITDSQIESRWRLQAQCGQNVVGWTILILISQHPVRSILPYLRMRNVSRVLGIGISRGCGSRTRCTLMLTDISNAEDVQTLVRFSDQGSSPPL